MSDKPHTLRPRTIAAQALGAIEPATKAVALPVHEQSGTIRAIVGLAWMDERVLPDDVVGAIERDAATLPE